MSGLFDDDDNDTRRTLSMRDKEILYRNADHKCQNCGKTIFFEEMEIGHKTAWSRGGRTTLKNSVCLCSTCNRLQGTDNWEKFQKKQGKEVIPSVEDKRKIELTPLLRSIKVKQLKELCEELNIEKPRAAEAGDFFTYTVAPSKAAYIKRIIKSSVDIEKIKEIVSRYKGQ